MVRAPVIAVQPLPAAHRQQEADREHGSRAEDQQRSRPGAGKKACQRPR